MQNDARGDAMADAQAPEGAREEMVRLDREHRELKARLAELNGRVYLSPAEELEKKKIQKLKLLKKDRLAVLEALLDGGDRAAN